LTKTCGNLGRFSRFCSRIRILGQPPGIITVKKYKAHVKGEGQMKRKMLYA
jgi:hypothetical protein